MKAELELLHSTYATALFEYGKAENLLDGFIDDFKKAVFIFKNEESLQKVMKDPRIGPEEKKRLLEAIDREIRLSREFLNFMKLLIQRKRFDIFHGIFIRFRDLYDTHKGQAEIFLYSSIKLDKAEIDEIKNNLKRTLKKEIIVEEKQDEKLVGGIKIQFENRVYDGSIKRELESIKEKIIV